MRRNDNIKGWVAFTTLIAVIGFAGWLEEADAGDKRGVVCMPAAEAPDRGPTRDVKASFSL